MSKISTYWKCQLIGWAAFVAISYIFNNIIYQDFVGFFYKAVIIFLFGLVFSHFIKLAVRHTGILTKKFSLQLIYLSILTIGFSIVATFVWMITLIKIGVWDIKVLRKEQPNVFFYQVYFYNLFIVLLVLSGWVLIYFLVHFVKDIREQERSKIVYEFKMHELEAKALRAQMNPHFIFNCINSIKLLIQKNEQEKAVHYLTMFSKLLRTVLQNSDQREITLFDELETCKLYTELESMRFNNKFTYEFRIDTALDLKSILVPALIIQPFIENAIRHGILPKEEGGYVTVTIGKTYGTIRCIVDDNGIGRETSKQNKFLNEDIFHQSKGEHLTHARLNLDSLLNERKASIEILDKKDEIKKACGTTVILNFQKY